MCSPEDGVFSIPKHVGTLVKFYTFYFHFVYELVRKYVLSPWRFLVTLDGPEFDNLGGGDNSMEVLVGVSS